jgi:hypothetical protein
VLKSGNRFSATNDAKTNSYSARHRADAHAGARFIVPHCERCVSILGTYGGIAPGLPGITGFPRLAATSGQMIERHYRRPHRKKQDLT